MKEVGCAPAVDQIAVLVDLHSIHSGEEIDLFGIFSRELGGDLGIVADGIAAEHIPVLADGTADISHHGVRRHILGGTGNWHQLTGPG